MASVYIIGTLLDLQVVKVEQGRGMSLEKVSVLLEHSLQLNSEFIRSS
jgi:hypothetical protein